MLVFSAKLFLYLLTFSQILVFFEAHVCRSVVASLLFDAFMFSDVKLESSIYFG